MSKEVRKGNSFSLMKIDKKISTVSSSLSTVSTEVAKIPKSDGAETFNATALASINAEASDAISDALNTAISTTPTAKSLKDILHKDTNLTYNKATDSLEAISDAVASLTVGASPVPTADTTDNAYSRDVVGNKEDAAVTTVGTTKSLVAYSKGILSSLSNLPQPEQICRGILFQSSLAQYATIGTSTLLQMGSSDWTIEGIVTLATVDSYYTIGNRGISSTDGYIFYIYAGALYFSTFQSGATQTTYSSTLVKQGVRTHVAATRAGAAVKLYINGIECSYGAQGTHVNPTDNASRSAFIGVNGSTTGAFMNGLLEEVRFWAECRSAANLLAYKDLRLTGSETNLRAYYKMNECFGTTLFDSTSNGLNATLVNMPYIMRDALALTNPVPQVDATNNATFRDVIGNKNDASVTSPTTTKSIMAYIKGMLGQLTNSKLASVYADQVAIYPLSENFQNLKNADADLVTYANLTTAIITRWQSRYPGAPVWMLTALTGESIAVTLSDSGAYLAFTNVTNNASYAVARTLNQFLGQSSYDSVNSHLVFKSLISFTLSGTAERIFIGVSAKIPPSVTWTTTIANELTKISSYVYPRVGFIVRVESGSNFSVCGIAASETAVTITGYYDFGAKSASALLSYDWDVINGSVTFYVNGTSIGTLTTTDMSIVTNNYSFSPVACLCSYSKSDSMWLRHLSIKIQSGA